MKTEFEFIDSIRKAFPAPDGVVGIGDDCAIVPQSDGFDSLVSTDMLVEGVHFILDDIGAYRLGWKAAAANFSDIAAMGGIPVGSFLSLAVPPSVGDAWLSEFLRGYGDISSKYGFPLLGGDTTASPDKLCICVTVQGKAPSGTAGRRNAARPGDLVCVTGVLGDSAAGLHAVLNRVERDENTEYLLERHYMPEPRMGEGRILSSCPEVHAMMDISDGVASDLRHILEESGVGAEIDIASLPISERMSLYASKHGLDPVELALGGGEDYELLFTSAPGLSVSPEYYVIGRITEKKGLVWIGSDRDYSGFKHF